MKREDAEEWTQSLGQSCAGNWRQIALANRLGVPKALGISTDEWVQGRLGGYIRLSIPERRDAISNLIDDGHTQTEIADILGVSQPTVSGDVSKLIDAKRKQSEEANAALANVIVEMPKVGYGTIVIDPPWDMEKIERVCRPNQAGFDYPTMTEKQIAELPINALSEDDCHLFCWTTQKFLPAGLRCIEQWRFKYVFLMTWYKPGGFQPHGLPQYNSEFVIYARRGAPKFRDTQAFNTCFQGERREHSRKPEIFYDTVRRVTADGRIDMFSRETRDGFEPWGNESDKFNKRLHAG